MLENERLRASFLDYGVRLSRLDVRMADGEWRNVVYGFDSATDYLSDTASVGAVVGRYANRIRRGHFDLPTEAVQLTINDGRNHLHGGPGGFGQCWWEVELC